MPALDAGIHVFFLRLKTWMAGTSPAMTVEFGTGSAYFAAEKRLSNELACTIGAEPAT
jgi:hypothetical protein